MSSERDSRQRAAARARLEREMAARREAARRKRLLQARIGAGVAGAVVLGAVVWIIVAAVAGGDEPTPPGDRGRPVRMHRGASSRPRIRPAARFRCPAASRTSARRRPSRRSSGFQVITIETNLGKVKVEMDLSKTPCTAASFAYLASKGFYDNTSCHRLVAEHLRAAVRRPERHRLRRHRRTASPTRTCPAGQAARLPRRRRGDGQHRPARQQRQPVLLPVRHEQPAGRLQPLRPRHHGLDIIKQVRRPATTASSRGSPAAATRTSRSPSPR